MIAIVLGAGLIMLGVLGFIAPSFLHANLGAVPIRNPLGHGYIGYYSPLHLGFAHNLVHIASGTAALFAGISSRHKWSQLLCSVLGVAYALVGTAGFVLGHNESRVLPVVRDDGKLFAFVSAEVKNILVFPGGELGTVDHIIHLVIGLGFLIGGIIAVLTAPEDRSLHD